MHAASLELCKELYELSGWEPDCWWDGNHGEPTVEDMKLSPYDIPAYSLGYLLRKLPEFLPEPSIEGKFFPASLTIRKGSSEWLVGYATSRKWIKRLSADTPEDAACKLCISLIKSGILLVDETTRRGTTRTNKDA